MSEREVSQRTRNASVRKHFNPAFLVQGSRTSEFIRETRLAYV